MSEQCPKIFPIQSQREAISGPLEIPWIVAEKAYSEYVEAEVARLKAERSTLLIDKSDIEGECNKAESEVEKLKAELVAEREYICGIIKRHMDECVANDKIYNSPTSGWWFRASTSQQLLSEIRKGPTP